MDELEEVVNEVLSGIDKTEVEADNGWWETSTGAEFGRRKKEELLEKLRHLTQRAADASPESPLKNKRQVAKRR